MEPVIAVENTTTNELEIKKVSNNPINILMDLKNINWGYKINDRSNTVVISSDVKIAYSMQEIMERVNPDNHKNGINFYDTNKYKIISINLIYLFIFIVIIAVVSSYLAYSYKTQLNKYQKNE
jgi:hypothetical protein